MTWQATRGALKHLGTLHGTGKLLLGAGGKDLGEVTYELDCFARGTLRSDSGEIVGPADLLAKAFRTGAACIVLADGRSIDIVLSDPQGSSEAAVTVQGGFPQFGDTA